VGAPNTKGDFGYYRNVTTPAGVIGNQVWYETDHDGLYEPQNGEVGVAGVVVQLTPPTNVNAGAGNGVPITTMTGADGGYAFTSLPAATYSVAVIDTFGILTGYQVTALGANQGQDNNNQNQQPSGYSVALPANGINTTADFGYYKRFDFTIEKTLDTLGDIRIGEPVKFTVRITNNGTALITVLPLTDTFDSAYLGFVSATPVTPNSGPPIGPVVWNDLTGSAPNGFGFDLAAGQNFEIVLTFKALKDTTLLSNQVTINLATVSGAKVDPDGPFGPLPEQPLPTKSDDAPVKITTSTGVEIASFAGAQEGPAVRLAWETASEARIAGYNVLQQAADGQFVAINSELIFAEQAGAANGARYELLTPDLAPGDYSFVLEVVRLDGTTQRLDPVVVSVAP
jgi:uncharacterized repeat protein (TIGR01451 family)